MKSIYFIFFFIATVSYSQIGINTNSPKASLDVVAAADRNSVLDGILIPQVSGDVLIIKWRTYTMAQKGIVVYVTAPPSIEFSTTEKINKKGFYFYDGTKWIGFGDNIVPNPNPQAGKNIYTDNGELVEDRSVSMDKYGLLYEFDPSSSKASFMVDESTFAVDVKENMVGLGTLTPSARLHIKKDAAISPILKIDELASTNDIESFVQKNNTYNLLVDEEYNVLKTSTLVSGLGISRHPYTINEEMKITTNPTLLPDFRVGTILSLNFVVSFDDPDRSRGLFHAQLDFSMALHFMSRNYTPVIMDLNISGNNTNKFCYIIEESRSPNTQTKLCFEFKRTDNNELNPTNHRGEVEIYREGGNTNFNIHIWNSIKMR